MVVLKILENQQGAATVIATSLKYSQAFNKVLIVYRFDDSQIFRDN